MFITLNNQKGGVGKTTLALIESDYLAFQGKKGLLIDLDPQASITEAYFPDGLETTIYNVIMGDISAKEAIHKINDLTDILPASAILGRVAQERESKLLQVVKKIKLLKKEYDYFIVDSPADLSSLASMAILLADVILMPLHLSKFPFQSMQESLNLISTSREMILDSYKLIAFYNRTEQETSVQTTFRSQYKQLFEAYAMSDSLLEISLSKRTVIEKRTASDFNLFENLKDEKVSQFFEALNKKIFEGK